ncbi:MAG: MFS transporter [Syntrophales bacterium]|nr:MFS transporter [Syntrophales bacterium]
MDENAGSTSTSQINQKIVLTVATMGAFLTPYMGSALNVALPIMASELSLNAITIGWVSMSFQLAAAVTLVPLGRVADIYGRKIIFLWGVVFFTIFSFLCGMSNTAELLIIGRFFQGIGGAMMFGTGAAILASAFSPQKRGAVLGLNVTAVYIGLVTGPPIGGLLTQYIGWRSIFFVAVPVGLILIAAILTMVKEEWADAKGEKFDLGGSVIYGTSLFAITYGFSTLPTDLGVIFSLLGLLFLVLFGLWELRVSNPVIDLRIFAQNRAFTFSNLAALLNYMATFAVGFLLSLYLQFIKGLSPKETGMILVIQPLMMALLSPLAGKLSDRIEPQIIASIGMTITTCGLVFFTTLNRETEPWFIYTAMLILGLGFALFASPNMNAALSSVDRKIFGVASGTLATMRIIGQMLSMSITMLVFALCLGPIQITPEYHIPFIKSLKTTFAILALLCFVGIFASLARGKIR